MKKNIVRLLFWILTFSTLMGCSGLSQSSSLSENSLQSKTTNYDKTGNASWYGKKHHGKRTVNGERFNMHELTAASRDLPLGSRAEVTNLSNGKKVIVKITDRGPFHSRRIIDVSYAAAKKLDFVKKGVTRVRVRGLSTR